MTIEISLLTLIVSITIGVFVIIGTLLSVFLPLFKRNERSFERLEAKHDRSVEELKAEFRSSVDKMEEKHDSSVDKMETKYERSVELMRVDSNRSMEKTTASLEHMREIIYVLNGHVKMLIGRVFGIKSLIAKEKDEETELV
ncbi:MAG: hypothetical protein OXF06_10865 [Bacteroidetes bacterium]|nr:hypothetical protein [Bacteroidota bacterium]